MPSALQLLCVHYCNVAAFSMMLLGSIIPEYMIKDQILEVNSIHGISACNLSEKFQCLEQQCLENLTLYTHPQKPAMDKQLSSP